jgi:4a-hydroxytetrahydrobiopterin dehydratase
MTDLTNQTCTACQGKEDKLSEKELQELLDEVPEWELSDDGWLVRDYEFSNFKECMGFVNQVALVAEAEFHHPNLNIHDWNQLRVEIYTHEIDGLTNSDFVLAAKISDLEP